MPERIAITVRTLSGLSAPMDPRFGRAAGFLLVQDGQILEKLENPAIQAAHGAGTGAAALMQEHAADVVISGAFGPKAHSALCAMGIAMRLAPPGLTAAEALEREARGELRSQELRYFR